MIVCLCEVCYCTIRQLCIRMSLANTRTMGVVLPVRRGHTAVGPTGHDHTHALAAQEARGRQRGARHRRSLERHRRRRIGRHERVAQGPGLVATRHCSSSDPGNPLFTLSTPILHPISIYAILFSIFNRYFSYLWSFLSLLFRTTNRLSLFLSLRGIRAYLFVKLAYHLYFTMHLYIYISISI